MIKQLVVKYSYLYKQIASIIVNSSVYNHNNQSYTHLLQSDNKSNTNNHHKY